MLTDRPPRKCAQPGCCVFGPDQYCVAHENKNVGRLNKPWKYLYELAAWRKRTRPYVLSRDPVCVDPHKIGCHAPSTVVDHIIDHNGDPKLFFDLKNLRGLCESCHNKKTMLTVSRDT